MRHPVAVSTQASARKELRELVRNGLLPLARLGRCELLVAGAVHSSRVTRAAVRYLEGPDLSRYEPTDTPMLVSQWRKRNLQSCHYPYLALVVDGEAELEFGTTWQLRKSSPHLRPGLYMHRLPAGSALIYPAGTPNPDGGRPHWFADAPQPASTILWFWGLPSGSMVHVCHSTDQIHNTEQTLYVHDPLSLPLLDELIQELSASEVDAEVVAALWLALVLRLDRGLQARDIALFEPRLTQVAPPPSAITSSAAARASRNLKRGLEYIDSHFHLRLTTVDIARHALISPSHLNALCRKEVGCSLMEYVRRLRLMEAQRLLSESDLPVGQIGRMCGYPVPANFNVIFQRVLGCTPGDYRARARTTASRNPSGE